MAETIERENFPAYKEFFQIITGTDNVRLFEDAAGDNVSRVGDEWHIGLRIGDGIHALWHEAGHIKYESLSGVESYLSEMSDGRAKFIWNVAEDVRIERLAEKHFDKKIFEPHRQMIIDNYIAGPPDADNLPNMVLATLYHLPWEMTGNANEIKALEYFKDELTESTYSEDPKATVQIAVRIAYYMDWLDKHTDDDDVVCGLPGSPTISDDKPEPGESTENPAEDKPDDGPAEAPDTPGLGSVPTSKRVEYDERLQGDLYKLLEDAETTTKKAVGGAKTAAKRRRARRVSKPVKHDAPRLVAPTGDDHNIIEVAPPTETIAMGVHARLLLDSLDDEGTRMRHSGKVTPSAWRLNHGYTKVFSRKPRTKGKVICLVDLSGSMDCWCSGCNSIEDEYGVRSGYLAWQTVGVLTSRFPDIEVFGFASSDTENFILPVPPREQPLCRKIVDRKIHIGGNADCSALAWLRSYLGVHESTATAIVITDGAPDGPFPVQCDASAHTQKIAHEMYATGMRYASVLINRGPSYLYPSDVQVSVSNAADIANLQGVLDWLIGS